jgi:hypothetical protein
MARTEWSARNVNIAKYLGTVELCDKTGEYHNLEVVETAEEIVFGQCTNAGLLQSGYYIKGFSDKKNLMELYADLQEFYDNGIRGCTDNFIVNKRM